MKIIETKVRDELQEEEASVEIITTKWIDLDAKLAEVAAAADDPELTEMVEEVKGLKEDVIENLRSIIRQLKRQTYVEMNHMASVLRDMLDAKPVDEAYVWATNQYSVSNLEQFDAATSNRLKQTLRDFFEPKGMEYEGWK